MVVQGLLRSVDLPRRSGIGLVDIEKRILEGFVKLDEELVEYHKDQNIEELADLIEVIHAAAKARGYTLDELERVRTEKAVKRGGFEKKLLLKSVFEGD